MKALIQKEIHHFLNNPYGFIILVLFGVFANFLFIKDVFVVGVVSMKQFFTFMPWIFMIFIPALSMRSLSEERRANTLEVLRTLPLSEAKIVISKFVAIMIMIVIGLVLTLGLPISLNMIAGSTAGLYGPEIMAGYGGILLYAAMAVSLSMFFSGLTSNQVVALLLLSASLFVLNVIGTDFLGSSLPKFAQDALLVISPLNQMNTLVNGVIDSRPLFFFCSSVAIFLFLTIADLEKRS